MFKKESRYITRGANEKLDLRLQLILWSMIDKLNVAKRINIVSIKMVKDSSFL
ncbi:DUF960 family protein [Turicibacter sanguinis]|uniref:DUF960 family protein n=1 Tax=Turicibacter sanguinis TaxID=154288 RepID=UPI00189EADA5|nr:DUF960 family protein [Turicibacter sanguinis]